jgi:hypothetical protein
MAMFQGQNTLKKALSIQQSAFSQRNLETARIFLKKGDSKADAKTVQHGGTEEWRIRNLVSLLPLLLCAAVSCVEILSSRSS